MGLPRCGTTVQKSGPGMRCQGPVMVTCLDYIANTASVSMPTHVQVEFGLTDKVGDDRLAGFTLGEVLFESCCPSLLVGETLARFWFCQRLGDESVQQHCDKAARQRRHAVGDVCRWTWARRCGL